MTGESPARDINHQAHIRLRQWNKNSSQPPKLLQASDPLSGYAENAKEVVFPPPKVGNETSPLLIEAAHEDNAGEPVLADP